MRKSVNLAGVLGFLLLSLLAVTAADRDIPPAPARYFNDYAGVTQPATQQRLNAELEQFEKAESSQIIVAIFPKLPEGAALEDFTYRTATAWKVGREKLNNGAILFLFVADRKTRIEVAYGLEGKIPDAIAKRIAAEQMRPLLQKGDYDGALTAGVNGLIQAARGEYKGTGKTVAEGKRHSAGRGFPLVILIVFALIFLSAMRRSGGSVYRRRGFSNWGGIAGGIGSGWGGGGGGGGFSGGGGGGFSGGGGSFGGGGASDSW